MKNLYSALQLGMWGPIKDYVIAQTLYCQLHAIQDTQIAVAVGKKYKPSKPLPFHDLFPTIDAVASLGTAEERRRVKTQEEMAKKALLQIGDNAPDWVKKAIFEAK